MYQFKHVFWVLKRKTCHQVKLNHNQELVNSALISIKIRPIDRSTYKKNGFLISLPKHIENLEKYISTTHS